MNKLDSDVKILDVKCYKYGWSAVFQQGGRKWENPISELSGDKARIAYDMMWLKIAQVDRSARDLLGKKIGFSEFKRIVRENS